MTEDDLPVFFEHQRDPVATRVRTIVSGGRVARNIVSFEQSGETLVGYRIGREFSGQGVATAALSKFVRNVRTRPLRAQVAKANPASIRVLEKCGFTRAGGNTVLGADGVEDVVLELG